jgi:hypothetical protein
MFESCEVCLRRCKDQQQPLLPSEGWQNGQQTFPINQLKINKTSKNTK